MTFGVHFIYLHVFETGLTTRTLGVMPEKAVKLKVVDVVGHWIDRHAPYRADQQATGHLSFLARWGVSGAAGGVVTTLVGKSKSKRAKKGAKPALFVSGVYG